MKLKVLITGISGQDGSYLAEKYLNKGYDVFGVIRESNAKISNHQYLGIAESIKYLIVNLEDYNQTYNLIEAVQPHVIFHLAAQSSVGESFKKPRETYVFNIVSTINILESARLLTPKVKIYQASSSEMFGHVKDLPIEGNEMFNPLSPYAVSKVSSHLIARNYRDSYNLFVSSGILFNHESYLRNDNFFMKKVINHALKIKSGEEDSILLGNLDIKRDFGLAKSYIDAMDLMMQQDKPGDFVICSGKSTSLRTIVEYIFEKLKISKSKIVIDKNLFRPQEIDDIYGDNSKARNELNWEYNYSIYDLIDQLIEEESKNKKESL